MCVKRLTESSRTEKPFLWLRNPQLGQPCARMECQPGLSKAVGVPHAFLGKRDRKRLSSTAETLARGRAAKRYQQRWIIQQAT